MIIPVLLRCFLHSGVVRSSLLRAISAHPSNERASDQESIDQESIGQESIDQDPINFIVRTFVLLAESNTILMSNRNPDADITEVVKALRGQFQILL